MKVTSFWDTLLQAIFIIIFFQCSYVFSSPFVNRLKMNMVSMRLQWTKKLIYPCAIAKETCSCSDDHRTMLEKSNDSMKE